MKEKEMIYRVYCTLENGEGRVMTIWEGEDITDFQLFTSMFEKKLLISISYETK